MPQNFAQIQATDKIKDSRPRLNDNFDAVASNFSGTAFPTANLVVGMPCWRTDQGKLYILKDLTPTWQMIFDGKNFVEGWAKTSDLGSGVNLNTLTTSGWHHQNSNGNASLTLNYPIAEAGLLQVFASSVMVYQFYTTYNTANSSTYARAYYNGTWGAWFKQWHNGNDGTGSGLDADLLDGYQAATGKTANTIPVRDANGKITADLAGKADTAGAADTATSAGSVPYSGITGKPNTIAGFGITDAAKKATVSTAAPSGGVDGDVWYQV